MLLADAVGFPDRVFARTEFAAPGAHWPALSFSRHAALQDWLLRFRSRRDIIVLVGADDPLCIDPRSARGRLLSVAQIDIPLAMRTQDLVPPSEVAREQRHSRERRDYSVPLGRIWRFTGRPLARDFYPDMIRRFGTPHRRCAMIEVAASEAARLMRETVALDFSQQRERAPQSAGCAPFEDHDAELVQAIRRIERHARKSGRLLTFRGGRRSMPESAEELLGALRSIFSAQNGCCALCDRPVPCAPANPLLQLSVDRIDNDNAAYTAGNIQITHLGCNRARNAASLADWSEYMALLRGRGARMRAVAQPAEPFRIGS